MKQFHIAGYIKKYQFPIVILSLLAGLFFYVYMQRQQTYSATAVISYTNDGAEEGLAPDGSLIDVSEIYSSQVMAKVFDRMGLNYNDYNLDELRSRVSINEIVSEEDRAVQEAKNEAGEMVESKPTKYYVTFTAERNDSDHPEEFARQVLDNMLDVYIQTYGENHINTSLAANDISDINERDYDYLEMAELLESSIDDALESVVTRYNENSNFRSAENGYSFSDLYQKFSFLKSTEVSNVFAYILNNQVTKNREALLAKYQNRIENYHLENNASQTEIDAINAVIDSYVNMMRESGNTNITADYILEMVHDTDTEKETYSNVDQTVEYDVLMKDYVKNRKDFEWALIDTAYCKYIMEIYSGEASVETVVELDDPDTAVPEVEKEAADAQSDAATAEITADDTAVESAADAAVAESADGDVTADTAGDASGADSTAAGDTAATDGVKTASQEVIDNTAAMLADLVSQTNELYTLMNQVNAEYNEYAGAENISLLSNIVVIANRQILLYAGIVVIIFLCIFCAVAVVIGRLGDIVDFYMYKDRKYDLPNRVGCDKFMEGYANQLVPQHFCCIVLRVSKMKEKNDRYGRDAMDNMMLKFNEMVKAIFPVGEDCFIALNGVGQYVIFTKNMTKEHLDTYVGYLEHEAAEYNEAVECKIEYECGSVESSSAGVYRIKLLLMNAMHGLKPAQTISCRQEG